LERVRSDCGHSERTSLPDLEKALEYYNLYPAEVGVAEDHIYRDIFSPKYGVYNTMNGPPGEHWIACYNNYTYDSFGRDASQDAEQEESEDDCGQRCIAWLMLCKRYGHAIPL